MEVCRSFGCLTWDMEHSTLLYLSACLLSQVGQDVPICCSGRGARKSRLAIAGNDLVTRNISLLAVNIQFEI